MLKLQWFYDCLIIHLLNCCQNPGLFELHWGFCENVHKNSAGKCHLLTEMSNRSSDLNTSGNQRHHGNIHEEWVLTLLSWPTSNHATSIWTGKDFWKVHLCIRNAGLLALKQYSWKRHSFQVDGWKGRYTSSVAMQLIASFQAGFSLERLRKLNYFKTRTHTQRWSFCFWGRLLANQQRKVVWRKKWIHSLFSLYLWTANIESSANTY